MEQDLVMVNDMTSFLLFRRFSDLLHIPTWIESTTFASFGGEGLRMCVWARDLQIIGFVVYPIQNLS